MHKTKNFVNRPSGRCQQGVGVENRQLPKRAFKGVVPNSGTAFPLLENRMILPLRFANFPPGV